MSEDFYILITLPVQITAALLALLGLISILRAPSIIRQIFGFKIILLAIELFLMHAGAIHGKLPEAQTLIIIMLVVESIFMAVALAIITNYYEHFPQGLVHRKEED